MSRRQSKLPEHIQKQLATYTSSSYRETVQRGFTCFSVGVPRETIIATQRTLVDNAMSMQELMSQVFRMIAEKNPVFSPVFDYARLNPVRSGYDYLIINENSIYSMIEEARRNAELESETSSDSEEAVYRESENDVKPRSIIEEKVRAPSLNFKTYKQDSFLQKKVTDMIVKLKSNRSQSLLTELLERKSKCRPEENMNNESVKAEDVKR